MGGSKSKVVSLGARSYSVERPLGRGTYGVVNLLEERETKQFFAMKVMHKVQILQKGEKTLKNVLRERDLLSSLGNPFIVNLVGSFQDQKCLYLVLDMMIGGELAFYLIGKKTIQEQKVKFYATNVLFGLQYLHSQRIVHRDLKPENLLMNDQGYLCLTDFNVALNLNEEGKAKGFAGTRAYIAPEIYKQEEYGPEVDLWSLGVILYLLIVGTTPWSTKMSEEEEQFVKEVDVSGVTNGGNDIEEGTKRILREKVHLSSKKFSEEMIDFLGKLLCPARERRSVNDCLLHHWFSDLNLDDIRECKVEAPFKPSVDRPNIDPNFAVREYALKEKEKKIKKMKVPVDDQEKFVGWDWLSEEMNAEYEELEASGANQKKGKKKGKRQSAMNSRKERWVSTPVFNPDQDPRVEVRSNTPTPVSPPAFETPPGTPIIVDSSSDVTPRADPVHSAPTTPHSPPRPHTPGGISPHPPPGGISPRPPPGTASPRPPCSPLRASFSPPLPPSSGSSPPPLSVGHSPPPSSGPSPPPPSSFPPPSSGPSPPSPSPSP
eukprot:CAMPEP_0201483954 /NCGR_PEP_ID=MMETSP0151_2-20130828/8154_1 /ASSEMBLY_ACC=CAM_ASM_000257 /TAXON_ID=200890 /ORGANISM="Paramoeba atlantica, Strain 621/1 / CCAP 1560/9" /LENGTH=545 /DNA_ID=CAMNT_0047867357 /DNA_START=8 /DNA_END=1642 /DNA_ORIENTATION=+